MPSQHARNFDDEPRKERRRAKRTEKGEFQYAELEKTQQRRAALQKKKKWAEQGDKENHNPLGQSEQVVRHKHPGSQALLDHAHDDDGETGSTESNEDEDQEEDPVYQRSDLVEQITFQESTHVQTPVRVRHIDCHRNQLRRINSTPPTDDPFVNSNLSPNYLSGTLRAKINKDHTSVKRNKRKCHESSLTEGEKEPNSEPPVERHTAEPPDSPKESRKKVKLAVKNLPQNEQYVLEKAQAEFQIRVCTKNAFPESDPSELKLWAEECWENANNELADDCKLTKSIQRLITERVSTIRGRLRERAVSLVPGKYGFMLSAADQDIKMNKELAAKLLDNLGYIYKDPDELSGMYEHPILADIIVSQFFNKKRRSDGIIYSAVFNPMPESLIALVFTTVHFAIDQWKSGTLVHKGLFSESEYHHIYDQHLNGIRKWKGYNEKTGRAFAKHQQRLFEIGSKFAGVDWELENEGVADPFADDRLCRAAAALE